MDKFFVIFVLLVFIFEKTLSLEQVTMMLSRDFSLVLFLLYLIASNKLHQHKFQPVISGKISTGLQFVTLILITLNFPLNDTFFYLFPFFGVLVLLEMVLLDFYPSPSKGNE